MNLTHFRSFSITLFAHNYDFQLFPKQEYKDADAKKELNTYLHS